MDGAKNAMYEQAGRSHSWSKVQPENSIAVRPQATMPAPPVVELPDFAPEFVGTIFDPQLDFIKPQKECQELAMAYVQMQNWEDLYDTDHGFSKGTIFADLDLPFSGKGACKGE